MGKILTKFEVNWQVLLEKTRGEGGNLTPPPHPRSETSDANSEVEIGLNLDISAKSQSAIICSKLAIETLEQDVKYVQS